MSASKSKWSEITVHDDAKGSDKGKGQDKRRDSEPQEEKYNRDVDFLYILATSIQKGAKKLRKLQKDIQRKQKKVDSGKTSKKLKATQDTYFITLKDLHVYAPQLQPILDNTKDSTGLPNRPFRKSYSLNEKHKFGNRDKEESEIERDFLSHKNTRLTDKSLRLTETNADVAAQLAEAKKTIDDLKAKIELLNRKTEEYENEKVALNLSHKEELGARNEENKKLKERLNRKTEEYENEKVALNLSHKDELGAHNEENKKLKERLEKINKDFECETKSLKDQYNRLEEEKRKSEYELQRLEAKTNQLTVHLDAERKAKEDALMRLEEEKRKSEYELQRIEAKTNQLTGQLDVERKAKEDALIRLEEEKRKSEYELQRLEKRYKDCEREVQTLRDQCKSKKEHEEKKMLPDKSYDSHGQQNKLVATGRAKRMVSNPSDAKAARDQHSISPLGIAQNTQLLEEEKRKADELHRLEKINKDFELEVKMLKDQCNRLEEEKKKSEYELQRLEAKVNQLTGQLDAERKAKEDALIRLEAKTNQLTGQLDAERKAKEDALIRLEAKTNQLTGQLDAERKAKEDALVRLEAKTNQLTGQLEAERKAKEEDLIRLEEEKRKSKYELQRLKAKTNQLTGQLEAERKAKEDALIRLSSMAPNKLRDNNRNIAGLSDPNRPTKLSEQFSELYDNEWTDAFVELEKQLNIELKEEETMETKIISYLRDILLKIHSMCNDTSSQRLKRIQEAFVISLDNTTVPTEVFKMIKDALKSMAPYCLEGIRKVVLVHLEETYSGNPVGGCLQHHNVKRYIDKCTDVCWYMSVQDPQVFMDGNKSPNGNFDSNKHREYTKKGPYEEYVVWPVLYLYKDGQMLSKGWAQGTKRENKKEMTEH